MSKEIVLILGASSDIGVDLISNIDPASKVIAHYYSSKERLEQVTLERKLDIEFIQCDLSDKEDVLKLVEKVEGDYGAPTSIVHLASSPVENIRFKSLTLDQLEKELSIGLKSIFIILNRFLPKMAKVKKGKVVLMLSSYTQGVPPMALAHYTTTKYAMLGLVKSLASEYASKNIQINAISPSMVETKFLNNINSKLVELSAEGHPLKRNAVVSDITPMINFLISEKSDYMTGINIPIAGGSIF